MNLDYATVFSLAPYVNENVLTFIGICLVIGAMAKSSQVGLHVWLPMAMEGLYLINFFYCNIYFNTSGLFSNSYSNKFHKFSYCRGCFAAGMVSLSKRGFHTYSKALDKSLIWVYDINNLSGNLYGLVEGAPFKTKTECAKTLAISRSTVLAYLDKGKLLNNKLIFSSPLTGGTPPP